MFKSVGRIVGWVLVGIAGTVAIFILMFMYVGTQVPVKLRSGGNVFTSSWDSGFVHASGTWVIEDNRQAFPLQFTELRCHRAENECRSATAEVSFGNTLSVDADWYEVVRWTDDTIIFMTSAQCVEYTYTISRTSERLVGTRTPKKAADGQCLSGIGKDTLQLSLKDGFRVQMALEEEARGHAQPFVWASIGVLWLFIATRIFRRRSHSVKTIGASV